MAEYRMSYDIAGQRKEVLWTPANGEKDLPAFGRRIMGQEFPTVACPTHGIEAFLKDHGITAIRSLDLRNPVVINS